MNKHTPGPWGNHLVDDTVVIIPRRPLPRELSVLGHSDVADAEDYANARLIAAAPDLLEALIVAEAALNRIRCTSHTVPWEDTGPAVEQARAAIARARGEATC
ncbi:hypothetical protein [Castellaniella denitrificans]|uniref:Uncharacterized protein n=1 Tax=Castellaniella denitrificans TaxID=56119 RepID=A0ABT4M6N4_9BURK|nr:hypothetical protein [Castellaniella denitrificans]MCZ4330749.1 hypothetical protein [Castellaniella denitrificans]